MYSPTVVGWRATGEGTSNGRRCATRFAAAEAHHKPAVRQRRSLEETQQQVPDFALAGLRRMRAVGLEVGRDPGQAVGTRSGAVGPEIGAPANPRGNGRVADVAGMGING